MFPRKAGGFFIWGLKKVVRLKKCFLYGFRFSSRSPWLYKCVKGTHIENRRDQTCLPLSTRSLRQSMTIDAGFTVHCLMIICKYLSLNDKPDYQSSGLNTYHFVSLFQWFKKGFRFDTAKMTESLENSDDRPDQTTGGNDNNTLGIPRAQLELKHMFIVCS